MKYYLVIVQNNSIQAVYAYENKDSALLAYHNELAYRAEGRDSTLCVLLDERGHMVCKEYWEKEVEEESLIE